MLQQCPTKRKKVSFLAPTCANSIILVFSEKILDDTQGAFRVDESPFEALFCCSYEQSGPSGVLDMNQTVAFLKARKHNFICL